ncbi:MAG: prephenate dehydrogenase/arogenate dehydrogenase family protein [Holophagaceae bacterium]|nr:prephenate dehydrogenase/arogenate dehydrogenase family protein [Holophagaceae bacterium]
MEPHLTRKVLFPRNGLEWLSQLKRSSLRIGIIGFGRFGAALAGLLREAGTPVRAWDPAAPVPGEFRVESSAALARWADFIVLAVPIPRTEAVLLGLRPYLESRHIVIDVGSVKTVPCAVLDRLLGDDVPHAGTHPLFGPLSLARADPLQTVICPSPRHPQAAKRVRDFFENLGSGVIESTPEAHDRVMAHTHATAFFLAKGLLDMGVEEVPFAPASFRALAAVIETVRADAGHLFLAIQNENPYASEARAQLISALQGIHQRLEAPQDQSQPTAMDLPDLGAASPALREVREVIDAIDQEIVETLRRRSQLSARAGEAKRLLGAPVQDPLREAELLKTRRTWAAQAGLDADEVEAFFKAILHMSRRTQGHGPM